MSWRWSNTHFLVLSACATAACIEDSAPSGIPPGGGDAATTMDSGGLPPVPGVDAGPITGQEAGLAMDSASQPPPPGDSGPPLPPVEAGAGGPCDLTGEWLITQRGVYEALTVLQAGVYWYYYQIEQNGSEFTVKKGLQCGGQTNPITPLLSGAVTMEASWPGMLQNNPHAGRRGTSSASGANCNVSFTRTTTVAGGTCPYFIDESHALPTAQASGSTPGWEDWDQDGNPGITLNVESTLASGKRFTVLRLVNDWSGPIAAGATSFKLAADPDQIESVLGTVDSAGSATGLVADTLKMLGVSGSNKSDHFAQFAKLQAGQVQGDDAAICAKIRELAPTLTAEANK